jgi:hypothetical protein
MLQYAEAARRTFKVLNRLTVNAVNGYYILGSQYEAS